VKVVSPGYLKEKQIVIPENSSSSEAETIVSVLLDNELAGYIALLFVGPGKVSIDKLIGK